MKIALAVSRDGRGTQLVKLLTELLDGKDTDKNLGYYYSEYGHGGQRTIIEALMEDANAAAEEQDIEPNFTAAEVKVAIEPFHKKHVDMSRKVAVQLRTLAKQQDARIKAFKKSLMQSIKTAYQEEAIAVKDLFASDYMKHRATYNWNGAFPDLTTFVQELDEHDPPYIKARITDDPSDICEALTATVERIKSPYNLYD